MKKFLIIALPLFSLSLTGCKDSLGDKMMLDEKEKFIETLTSNIDFENLDPSTSLNLLKEKYPKLSYTIHYVTEDMHVGSKRYTRETNGLIDFENNYSRIITNDPYSNVESTYTFFIKQNILYLSLDDKLDVVKDLTTDTDSIEETFISSLYNLELEKRHATMFGYSYFDAYNHFAYIFSKSKNLKKFNFFNNGDIIFIQRDNHNPVNKLDTSDEKFRFDENVLTYFYYKEDGVIAEEDDSFIKFTFDFEISHIENIDLTYPKSLLKNY